MINHGTCTGNPLTLGSSVGVAVFFGVAVLEGEGIAEGVLEANTFVGTGEAVAWGMLGVGVTSNAVGLQAVTERSRIVIRIFLRLILSS
jgi:hypothetical protein